MRNKDFIIPAAKAQRAGTMSLAMLRKPREIVKGLFQKKVKERVALSAIADDMLYHREMTLQHANKLEEYTKAVKKDLQEASERLSKLNEPNEGSIK